MKLKPEEERILRRYINRVESIVAKFVPSPVPGIHKYNLIMDYLDLSNKLKALLNPPTVKKRYRQIDLEEQIKEEKRKNAS